MASHAGSSTLVFEPAGLDENGPPPPDFALVRMQVGREGLVSGVAASVAVAQVFERQHDGQLDSISRLRVASYLSQPGELFLRVGFPAACIFCFAIGRRASRGGVTRAAR